MNLRLVRQALDRRSALAIRNRVLLDEVDSTNDLALRLVRSNLDAGYPPSRALVIALRQVAGRGRLGRRWIGDHGQAAYLSMIVPDLGAEDLATLPLLVGVGLCHKISVLSDRRCRLKWPNDLMVSGRKVGGVLIDCVSRGTASSTAVIGVGVNYGESQEVSAAGGISLSEISRHLASLSDVIAELVVAVEEELTHLGDMAYSVASYRESSAHRMGDALRFRNEDGVQNGVFAGLDEQGYLVLRVASGELRLGAGEIIEERAGSEP